MHFHVVHGFQGGLETGRCCFSQSVNPLDVFRQDGSIKGKHKWMCTHTKSLFSFPRDRALAQGWPLYHNNLIHFPLSLSVYQSLLTCPLSFCGSPELPCSDSPVPLVLFFFAFIWIHATHVIEYDSCIFILTVCVSIFPCGRLDRSIFHSRSTNPPPTLLCHLSKVSCLTCSPFYLLSASLPLHWLHFLSSLSQLRLLQWPFHWV